MLQYDHIAVATLGSRKIHDAIAGDPLVAKIMEIFPGARIDSITAAASPEMNPQNSDDTASASNEEMSG